MQAPLLLESICLHFQSHHKVLKYVSNHITLNHIAMRVLLDVRVFLTPDSCIVPVFQAFLYRSILKGVSFF